MRTIICLATIGLLVSCGGGSGDGTDGNLDSNSDSTSGSASVVDPIVTSQNSANEYILSTNFQGADKVLTAFPNAEPETIRLAAEGGSSSQRWLVTGDANSSFRFTNQLVGSDFSIDVVNDGINDKINLAPSGNFTGQQWNITPLESGFCQLTNNFTGPDVALDIVNDANSDRPRLSAAGNFSGQQWRILNSDGSAVSTGTLAMCSGNAQIALTSSGDARSCPESYPTTPLLDDDYYQMQLCGWNVAMNVELFNTELAEPVFNALSEDLLRIESSLPMAALTAVKSVTIWLEVDVAAFPGGVYHPSADWLNDNGYPEKWAKGIQLGNAQNYLSWTQDQPAIVLHELAHAYDDVVYGSSHPDLLMAFGSAEQSGIYESVEYVSSTQLQRAYALTNSKEYFAELTEAYFWQNDFFPFNRAELQQHDSAGFSAIETMWRQE